MCDRLLILLGAAGVAIVLGGVGWLRAALLAAGAVFLVLLGVSSLRAAGVPAEDAVGVRVAPTIRRVVVTCVGVSWGNPHAVLHTVVVLGSAIGPQAAGARPLFAAGALSASWLFFLVLALAGAAFEQRLSARGRRWLQRFSGSIMLLFAVVLAAEAVRSVVGG